MIKYHNYGGHIMRKNLSKKAEDTKGNIRRCAKRLFVEYGYKGTTVREIAAQAGVTTGALYKYYGTKEEIILDLFRDVFTKEWELAFDLDENCTYQEYIEMNVTMNQNLAIKLGYDLLRVYFTSQNVLHDNRSLLITMDEQGYEEQDAKLIHSLRERYDLSCTNEELEKILLRAERGVFLDWIINKGNFHIGHATRQMLTAIFKGLMK